MSAPGCYATAAAYGGAGGCRSPQARGRTLWAAAAVALLRLGAGPPGRVSPAGPLEGAGPGGGSCLAGEAFSVERLGMARSFHQRGLLGGGGVGSAASCPQCSQLVYLHGKKNLFCLIEVFLSPIPGLSGKILFFFALRQQSMSISSISWCSAAGLCPSSPSAGDQERGEV